MKPGFEESSEKPDPNNRGSKSKSMRDRLTSAAVWSVVGRVLAVGAFFGSHFLLGRHLLKPDYAAYVMVSAIVAIATIFVTFGTSQILIRTIRRNAEPVQAILSCLRLVVLFGFVAALVLLAASRYLGTEGKWEGLREYAPWVAVWFALSATCLILSSALQAMDDFRSAVLVGAKNGGLIPNVLFLVLLYVRSRYGLLDLGTIISMRAMLQLFTLFAALIFVKNRVSRYRRSQLFKESTRVDIAVPTASWFLQESWYTVVTQFVAIAMAELDVILVGFFVIDSDLANYGAAKNLINVVRAPLLMISIFLGPFIAELYYARQLDRLEKLLRGAATIIGLPCLLAAATYVCFPEIIFELTYGAGFYEAVPLLRVFTLGTIVFVLTGCNGLTLVMTGHQRELMICSLAVLLVYAVSAPFVLAHCGVMGVAW
ncbi:MAG: oligosaccharide flippase family protein, partial [Pirellulales bacterium]